MADTVKHKEVVIPPDGPLIDGADWLAEHVFNAPAIGSVLVGDPSQSDKVNWVNPSTPGQVLTTQGEGVLPTWQVPDVVVTTTPGDLIRGRSGDGVAERLGIGAAQQVLSVDGGMPTWHDPLELLPVGSEGQVLTTVGGASVWSDPVEPGFANPMTTLGDVIVGGVDGVADRLGVGSDGEVLRVVSGVPDWQPGAGPSQRFTIRIPIEGATLPDATGTINNPPEIAREVSTGSQTTNAPKVTQTVAKFDATTDEHLMWNLIIPDDYNFSMDPVVRLIWKAATATSGSVCWKAAIAVSVNTTTDDDVIVFNTVTGTSTTAPGTQGQTTETVVTLEDDNTETGRKMTLFVGRDADGTLGTDDMTGDAILLAVSFEYGAGLD